MTDHLAPPPARPGDQPPTTAVSPWFAWPALLLTAGPSFVTLAHFQHELFAAKWLAAPWFVTFGMALAVDVLGITAGVYWFRSPVATALRAWGRFFAIAAVLGSTALTCWGIALLHGATASLLGLVPAIVVFVATKFVTLWQHDRATARGAAAEHADTVAAAEQRAAAAETRAVELADTVAALQARLDAVPAVPPSTEVAAQDFAGTRPLPAVRSGLTVVGSDKPGTTNAEILADLRKWIADPDREEPSRNALIREYGIGATRATKLLAKAKDAAPTAATGT